MFAIEYLACLIKHMLRELDGFVLFYFIFTLNSLILLSIRTTLKVSVPCLNSKWPGHTFKSLQRPGGGKFRGS